jgi:hypothetical protein
VGPRADLDRCGKSRPHRDSIPGPSSPQLVAIPTELPGPLDCDFKLTYLISCNIRASKMERVICNDSSNCKCLSYVGFPLTALISLFESAL